MISLGALEQEPLKSLVEGLKELGYQEGRNIELVPPWPKATRSIPIVMVVGSDPIALGIVKNLARPEANVTGLAWA